MKFKLTTHSAAETMRLGQQLARDLPPGAILCLFGDLGSGKTTFVKGLAQGLGVKPESVISPTFVLLNIYEGEMALYHFDFYRLQHPDEIAAIGYEEFLYGEGVAVIEWPERLGENLPERYLRLDFIFRNETERDICLSATGFWGRDLIARLKSSRVGISAAPKNHGVKKGKKT